LPTVLSFSKAYEYAGQGDSITLPVLLRAGDRQVDLFAGLDTGASHCLFDRRYAEALALEVELGIPKTFMTANSRLQTFGHEVTITTLGIEVHSLVFFFADPSIERNVLGRHGWLDRMRIGIVDHDQVLYAAEYDEVISAP
jgi:hypothetical protein